MVNINNKNYDMHVINTNNPHNVTKTQVGLSNVVNADTTTTSNITDSTDKRFVTDAQKVVLNNTSGANTGDETSTTIINKIGYTPENIVNKGVNNGYCGLDSGGKVPLQNLPSTLLKYVGTWNASTNTPALTSPDLTKTSWVYEVTVAGTIFGEDWKPGDWLIYNASGVPEKSDNSDDVVSVNGKTGIVVINKADVGLSNVDNTSDLDKPISSLTQTALNLKADSTIVTTHTTNTNNPHAVTKTQVGLNNVDNTSDLNKPISTLTQTALNLKADGTTVSAHTTNTSNPHTVTKTQVGLGNVVNIDTSVTTNITDTSLKRFVSDTEKLSWNSKRDTLPEITQRTTTSAEWYSVAYGNGIFVATGINRVMWSTDGVTWPAASVVINVWRSVAYGNGIFVAVSSTGANRVMWSTNGVAWIATTVETSEWAGITYGNGVFVAVALSGTNRVMRSVDGVTWTPVVVSESSWWSIAYGNGVFVAVAPFGSNRVMRSTDGVTWTVATAEASEWAGITYGNGVFVAVASYGTNRVMRSVDGVTWTAVSVEANQWRSVIYGNGMFVAVASVGTNRVMYSVDAVNWYYKNIQSLEWYAIGYGDGMFVALSKNSSNGLLTIGNRTYSDKSRVVKKSVISEISVTILPTDWTGSTAPFEKTIPITISGEQITNTTHNIKITPVWSGTITQKKAAMASYSYISEGAITSNNTFTLTCYDYKPEAELTLNLEVWRKW